MDSESGDLCFGEGQMEAAAAASSKSSKQQANHTVTLSYIHRPCGASTDGKEGSPVLAAAVRIMTAGSRFDGRRARFWTNFQRHQLRCGKPSFEKKEQNEIRFLLHQALAL